MSYGADELDDDDEEQDMELASDEELEKVGHSELNQWFPAWGVFIPTWVNGKDLACEVNEVFITISNLIATGKNFTFLQFSISRSKKFRVQKKGAVHSKRARGSDLANHYKQIATGGYQSVVGREQN